MQISLKLGKLPPELRQKIIKELRSFPALEQDYMRAAILYYREYERVGWTESDPKFKEAMDRLNSFEGKLEFKREWDLRLFAHKLVEIERTVQVNKWRDFFNGLELRRK
jgi:hypothetical protein